MASRRLLTHTVELFNYIGEIDDEATYQKTILRFCYCPSKRGVDVIGHGKVSQDEAKLYIFDVGTLAESEDGHSRSYLPFHEWEVAEDKTPYWTLNGEGDDFFKVVGAPDKLKITDFSRKSTGTRRMWHFEVTAQ